MADWTEKRVKLLISMHRDGYSASQIAERLGELGLSRNAVIGKLHRLGFSRPKSPARQRAGAKRQLESHKRRSTAFEHTPDALKLPAKMPKEPTIPSNMPAARATGAAAATNAVRFNDCRWPIGDPHTAEFRFCGARRKSGYAYCAHHQKASEKG